MARLGRGQSQDGAPLVGPLALAQRQAVLEILEVRLPAPAAVDGGGALVGGQEGVEGLAQRQQSVVESPHSCKPVQGED